MAALTVFGALAAVGFMPLFGGPGYEQSLASGLVVPSAAAIATAVELSSGALRSPAAGVRRGLTTGVVLAGVAFVTALLHAARAGACDLWGGSTLFVLTAGFGGAMGGLWGAVAAEACRGRKARRLACVLLGLAGPLAGIAVSFARFCTSPMIFAYDPFFGYFSGTLYDTVVDVRTGLWTYRAGSLATIAAALLLAPALARGPTGRLALGTAHRSMRGAMRVVLGLAALTASLAVTAEGPALGHWQTAASIARRLGGRRSGPRCDVVFPDSTLPADAELLLRDCEQEVSADEDALATHLDGRLTAYVFADRDQKRELMGAADTSIAKPWRREVYVQASGFPHPVLGHEVAHVVAGSFARGPLRVGGGLWPDPGLIEGIAVATSPDDDELTDAQWARAMMDLGILPPLRSLFSLGFLGQSADKSYTVAGAFVGWVLGRWGIEVVRPWYGGQSIEGLTGRAWADLDREFRSWLAAVPMPEEAASYARGRFERPGVWGRRCPHAVDALNRAADRCRDEHRFERAKDLYGGALARDPHDWHALLDRARIDLRYGDAARGREDLDRMGHDARIPPAVRDHAEEALADDDLIHGRGERAAGVYREIAARTLDEDFARTLDVKGLSAEDPSARRAVVDLLIGEPGRPVDAWLGALSVGQWAAGSHSPIARYLVGKNLALHGAWVRAAESLDQAWHEGVPTDRVARELLRERAVVACVLRDHSALVAVRQAVEDEHSPFAGSAGGRRDWVLRFAARCLDEMVRSDEMAR